MVLPVRPEEELLTPGGVAALLFVDPKTVTRWAVSGKLRSLRTPGGHRRYLKSDVLAIMAGLHTNQRQARKAIDHAPRATKVPTQGSPALHPSESLDSQAAAAAVVAEAVAVALESVAAEAAEDVVNTAAAVSQAARRAADAAQSARGAREFAATAAAQSVARDAERTATRVHIRADVAALQVRQAAELAAEELVRSHHDGTELNSLEVAADVAMTVQAAADETARDTLRAAAAVANAVAAAASHVAQMVAMAEDSIADDVSVAAQAVEHQAQATAVQVAFETDARAAGVAMAAREAAAALLASYPTPLRASQVGSVRRTEPRP